MKFSRADHNLLRTRGLFLATCFVFISLGVVAAWFISADSTSSIAGLEAYVRFMFSPWMLATHVVALSFIGFGLWFLDAPSFHPEAVSDLDAALQRCSRLLVLVLFLFSSALLVVGYLFVSDLRLTFRTQRLTEEEGIARLKAQQIDKWILDRAIDVETLARSLRGLPVERITQDRDVRQIVRVLFGESLAGNADRVGLSLIALDGSVLATVGEAIAGGALREVLPLSTNAKGLKIVDVHLRDGSPSALAMEFVLPLLSGNGDQTATAAIVLTADPGRDLFRQIVKWPVDSPGSEVVIVRQEGGTLQLLSDPALLGRSPPALSFRLPLTRGDLPGVQSIQKGDGSREGIDYRGKRVFSASAHVAGVPWQVVAKTDVDEAMATWRRKTIIVAAVICATILSAALVVTILWRGQRSTYRAYRLSRDKERAAMARHFEAMVKLARDPVFLTDPEGNIVESNEAATAAYGYGADEFHSLPFRKLEAAGEQGKATSELFETIHRRKDGTTFPVEISSRTIAVDGRAFRQSFVRDISARRELEGRVQRLARIQRALRAANSILLRATSQASLLQGMCDVIVHMGGYWMAFIAVAHHDSDKSVGFAAIAGVDAENIKAAGVRWDDSPAGSGPTGMALKTGAIQIQQDFASNLSVLPWRSAHLHATYGSGISLPLRVSNVLFGTLTIYAAETNAFDDEEVDLLTEFVDNLTYGIGTLRSRRRVDPAQGVRSGAG